MKVWLAQLDPSQTQGDIGAPCHSEEPRDEESKAHVLRFLTSFGMTVRLYGMAVGQVLRVALSGPSPHGTTSHDIVMIRLASFGCIHD